jgi:hypothetical protein
MLTYEESLDANLSWAFEEGSLYFERRSLGHQTLRRFAARLKELEIDYAIVGAMAMFFHGFRRFTHAVDVIVTPEGLARILQQFEALDYLRVGKGNRLLDAQTGVTIKFLVSGPGTVGDHRMATDIPAPREASIELDGIRFVTLSKLVELKLASGQVSYRLKDLADVQRIIQELKLPEDFADQYDPILRDSFREYWGYAQIAANDEY